MGHFLAPFFGAKYDGQVRVKGRTTTTDTLDHQLIAAPVTGLQILISRVTVSNTSATPTQVQIKSGAAGSIIWTIPAPANGGAIEPFPDPLEVGDATALYFAADNGVATVTVSAAGVTAPSS